MKATLKIIFVVIFIVIFTIIGFFSCECYQYAKAVQNDTKRILKAKNDSWIFIPNGSLIKSHSIVKENIKYTVGVSSENKIIYISTTDNRFIIGGLKINDTLPESYFNKEWGYKMGWGYFIEIESGWFAGFDFQTEPNKESKIQWFFKFDFDGSLPPVTF